MVINATWTYIHGAADYSVRADASSGCAPCGGSQSAAVQGQLPSLNIERLHRSRFGMLHWSFGNGVALSRYDTHLELWSNWGRIYDPAMSGEWTFLQADANGVLVDNEDATIPGARLFTAAGQPTTASSSAAFAEVTTYAGEVFRFEVFRLVADSASDRRAARLISITDRNGNQEVITYQVPAGTSDAALNGDRQQFWKIATITDAYGRQAAVSYRPTLVNGDYAISSISLPNGTTLAYTYGMLNDGDWGGTKEVLTGVAHPGGDTTTLSGYTDTLNNLPVVVYDDQAGDGKHRRKSVWFDGTGRVRMVAGGANEISYLNGEINEPAFGQIHRNFTIVRKGDSQVMEIFHEFGNVAKVRYAKNFTWGTDPTTWTWETSKDYTWLKGPYSGERQYVKSATDGIGRTTTYSPDEKGGFSSGDTYPDGSTTQILYNAFKTVSREVDRQGRVMERTFDAKGNTLTETQAAGTADAATTRWDYNTRGQVTAMYQPLYNSAQPTLHVTNYVYNAAGYLTSIIDPADTVGAARPVWTFTYDTAGRLTRKTDPTGSRFQDFAYDARNRVVGITYADGSSETTTFGTGVNANLVVARKDRDNHVTTFGYDLDGREISRVEGANAPAIALTTTTTYLVGTTLPVTISRGGDVRTFAYDYRHRLISETAFPSTGSGLTTTHAYDLADQKTSTTDPYGRVTYFRYDVNGRLVRTIRELVPGGVAAGANLDTLARSSSDNPPYAIEEMTYNAIGEMLTRTDARGFVTTMAYDNRGRLTTQTEAVGTPVAATTSRVYDVCSNLIQVTDARGFVTAMTYTGRDLMATMIEAVGTPVAATSSYTYTSTKKVATMQDALLRVTTNLYGVCCDRLASVTDPAGFLTVFTYSNAGDRLTVTDGNNLTTTTTYDARHRVTSVRNAANETTTILYAEDASTYPTQSAGLGLGAGPATTANGSAMVTINPAGESLFEIRDGVGRTVRRLDGLGKATTMSYDTLTADGTVTLVAMKSSDPLGHLTLSLADGAGRARVLIDATGARTEHAYDAQGNKLTTKRILPGGAPSVVWSCSYDARNRDVTCTTPGAAPQTKVYDANSNLLSVVDGLNGVTASVYDARNRKVGTTDRINATTTFTYDAVSNLLTILDQDNTTKGAAGNPTVYTYNSRNLLQTETFPTGQAGRTVRSYLYDGGRRLTQRTITTAPASAFTEVTTYQYDNANRLITRSYVDGKNDAFAYDPASRLTTATSGRYANRVVRAYDAASRLTAETLSYTAGPDIGIPLTVGYGYDADDRLTGLTYPDGSVIARSYTDRDEVKQIWDGGASQQARTYDAAGRLTSSLFGNNRFETRTYVPGDVLVASIVTPAASGTPVSSFTYTYDANKRKLTELDGAQTSVSQRFSYDPQDRLTNWKVGTGVAPADPSTTAQTWALSPVGDWNALATTTATGTTTQARTHSNVHELLTIGGSVLTYDAKGNLTKDDQGQLFAWDVENRLLTATNLAQGQGVSAAYSYDALGRRVRKETKASAAAVAEPTTYVSAGAQEVLEVTGDLSAAPWLPGAAAADPEGAGAAPFNPTTGQGARGSLLSDLTAIRYNFQPTSTETPDGWLSETGSVRANASARGWTVAQTGTDRAQLGRPLYDSFLPLVPATVTWQVPVANGTHAVVIMCGDAASRAQTNHLLVNGVAITDPTPYDGRVTNGYETGSFDGYALTVNVSNGLLTIQAGAGALAPKLNFIEIGAAGSSTSTALNTAVAAAAAQATLDTAKAKAKTPPTVKRNVWGSYVDELVSYTVKKPRKTATRYYAHSNHLYSVAAITSSTGSVVERWSYNAYGVPTIKNSANATIAKSAVGNDRGFTGYKLDSETGLYFARSRFYSARVGRFFSRQPWSDIPQLDVYNRLLVDRYSWSIGRTVLHSGYGNYIQSRFMLYDYAGGDPANRLEPYSWWLVGLLFLPPFTDNLDAPTEPGDISGPTGGVTDLAVGAAAGAAVSFTWKMVCCSRAVSATASETAKTCCKEELRLTVTVANHAAQRPFVNSPLLAREIMASRPGVLDPQGVVGVLRWDVPGTMNGSCGTWQLVVDATGRVLHFNFVTP
jgi:RHS repeat-associated protein